ncbi:MAG: manganese efflux pump MntP family protein [Tannerella sp.]|jgi:putative Mn2+ efflux pump MntP|nr:manganese efflux pump MntP family protein [Tannerella sp.]
MDIFSIILIAIGLAMDCFAVSISKGICAQKFYAGYTFRMALLFGLFQAVMPFIGFIAGSFFVEQIKAIDHWIALLLLGFIGVHTIIESLKKDDDEAEPCEPCKQFKWKTLLSLAVATSIDALATGVVFVPFSDVIYQAVIMIGCTSFLFSFAGMGIGVYFGKRFKFNVELLGGIILVCIGLKIWVEHVFF